MCEINIDSLCIFLIKIQQVFKKIIENIYNDVSIHKQKELSTSLHLYLN